MAGDEAIPNKEGSSPPDSAKAKDNKKKKSRERTTTINAATVTRGDLVIPVIAEGTIRSRHAAEIKAEITERLHTHVEVASRAYDPCLSCATHALGRMPLTVELVSADGAIVDQKST